MCAPNQAPPQTDPGVNPNTSGAPVIQPKQPSNIGQKTVGVGSAAAGGGLALGAHLMPELAPALGTAAIIAPLIGGLVSGFMGGKPKTPIQTPATPTFNGTPGVQAPTLQVAQGPSIGSSLVSSGGSAVGSLAGNQLQKNQMSKQNDLYQQILAAMKARTPTAPAGPASPAELPLLGQNLRDV